MSYIWTAPDISGNLGYSQEMLSLETFEREIGEVFLKASGDRTTESTKLVDTCMALFRQTCLPPGGPYWTSWEAVAADVHHGQALANPYDATRKNLDRVRDRLDEIAAQGRCIGGFLIRLVDKGSVRDSEGRPLKKGYRLELTRPPSTLPVQQPGASTTPSSATSPYKRLHRYEEDDAAIYAKYFNRDIEKQQFLQEIQLSKIVTIIGESGVGKSSFIRAAIIPALKEQPNTVLVLIDLASGDPTPRLLREIALAIGLDDSVDALPDGQSIKEFISHAKELHRRRLVIFLDQVERFVLLPANKEIRDRFFGDLVDCLWLSNADVHFVLSVRKDHSPDVTQYFKSRAELRHKYGETLLPYLTQEQASAAIELPLRDRGFNVSPALVAAIVTSLSEKDDLRDIGGVYPPILQVVCYRFYQRVCHKALKADGALTLDLNDYEEVGDVRSVISHYLEDALHDLGAKSPIAISLLKELTTFYRTTLPAEDLYPVIDDIRQRKHYEQADVDEVLDRLEGDMIIKRMGPSSLRRYQLVHDCIAGIVFGWMDKREIQAKSIRGLLVGHRTAWHNSSKAHEKLLGPETLEQVVEQIGYVDFAADDIEFIAKSAVKSRDAACLNEIISRQVNRETVLRWALELCEARDLDLRLSVSLAMHVIGGKGAIRFLTQEILTAESELSLSVALNGLIHADGTEPNGRASPTPLVETPGLIDQPAVSRVLAVVKSAAPHEMFRLFAHLEEDYAETLTGDGQSLPAVAAHDANLSFLEKHFLLSRALWQLRFDRIGRNSAKLGRVVTLGLWAGVLTGLVVSIPSMLLGASLTNGYNMHFNGKFGGTLHTGLESVVVAVVWIPLSCWTAAAVDSLRNPTTLRRRISQFLPAAMVSGPVAALWTALLALMVFYGDNIEPFRTAMPAALEMASAVLFANTGFFLALALTENKNGLRDPWRVVRSSIASVSLTQLLHVGYVRLLHGRFFLEGRLFVESDGTMHQYLTYMSPRVWDDALRAGLAAIVMSIVYVLWANAHIADFITPGAQYRFPFSPKTHT